MTAQQFARFAKNTGLSIEQALAVWREISSFRARLACLLAQGETNPGQWLN